MTECICVSSCFTLCVWECIEPGRSLCLNNFLPESNSGCHVSVCLCTHTAKVCTIVWVCVLPNVLCFACVDYAVWCGGLCRVPFPDIFAGSMLFSNCYAPWASVFFCLYNLELLLPIGCVMIDTIASLLALITCDIPMLSASCDLWGCAVLCLHVLVDYMVGWLYAMLAVSMLVSWKCCLLTTG